MEKERTFYYVSKTLRLTNYLVKEGFPILKTDKCRDNPRFTVFFHEDSTALRDALSRYSSKPTVAEVE